MIGTSSVRREMSGLNVVKMKWHCVGRRILVQPIKSLKSKLCACMWEEVLEARGPDLTRQRWFCQRKVTRQ